MIGLAIGCIGWGSLLWDPRDLPMEGGFQSGGPRLPIEFSRVAMDGRVTLVIDPAAEPIETYWTRLAADKIESAVEGLGRREKIAPARFGEWVGVEVAADPGASRGDALAGTRRAIRSWLATAPLDAVVWTALPSRRPDGVFAQPGVQDLMLHLRGLEGESLERAEEYIRRAPPAVDTVRRRLFEAEFGWTPLQGRLPEELLEAGNARKGNGLS